MAVLHFFLVNSSLYILFSMLVIVYFPEVTEISFFRKLLDRVFIRFLMKDICESQLISRSSLCRLRPVKGLKRTVLNQAFSSLYGGSIEITI